MAKVNREMNCAAQPTANRAQWQHLYNTAAWKRLRRAQLSGEPLCRMCGQMGRTTLASVADHIEPHKGNTTLFFAADNLQSLCKTCHDGAKAREELRGYAIGCDVQGNPIDRNHPWNKP